MPSFFYNATDWYRAMGAYRAFWKRIEQDRVALDRQFRDASFPPSQRLMIVVSTGRTGTQWLANTLNLAADGVAVHASIKAEQFAWVRAFNNETTTAHYCDFRVKYLKRAALMSSGRAYIECNSALRRHVQVLRARVPTLYIPHIIRDGRDSINSVMHRKSLTSQDPIAWCVRSNLCRDGRCWRAMDKFQRACWIWRIDNEYLTRFADRTIRFEQMITDFDLFHHVFCEPHGIELSASSWGARLGLRENLNKRKTLTGWHEWTVSQRRFFEQECGALMSQFGSF